MSKFNELVDKLKEILQIDRPELDFGVYRILNTRADEINEYLQERLRENVKVAISDRQELYLEQLRYDLKIAKKGAIDSGNYPDKSPKVIEFSSKINKVEREIDELENAVFTHLLTFFSRYYESGDFVSKRRYKGDTYAIPYGGEEVMLHWANKDQYYVKSGENFSNYSFKLDDGRVVDFRLVAADTAKDNRKDNGHERCFVLAERKTITRTDDDGDKYEEEILPVQQESRESEEGYEYDALVIRFEYKAMHNGSKQNDLIKAALNEIFSIDLVAKNWQGLIKTKPTENNPDRTLLEKHLTQYTAKNTADYFIHKNLGKFLRDELDFYIKNEVMNLDDIQHVEAFGNIENKLRMIQCLRGIALDLISFLAQLEDFQKKLWTKKKFVVSSHYCITLNLIPETFYAEIAGNDAQWEQWRNLGLWLNETNGNENDFLENPYLPIDTSIFSSEFSAKVVAEFQSNDDDLSGILIQGDNYQALNLLAAKYHERVNAVYIDPPYNTNSSEILYKNGYKNSSWISLISDRVKAGHRLLQSNGIQVFTIDDVELENSLAINNLIFDKDNHLATTPIRNNPQGRSTVTGFSVNHEYAIFHRKSDSVNTVGRLPRSTAQNNRYNEIDESGDRFLWENFRKTGTDSSRRDRPKQFFPLWVQPDGTIYIPKMEWNTRSNSWDVLEKIDKMQETWPVDSTGAERVWKWGVERTRELIRHLKCETCQNKIEIYRRNYINDKGRLPGTWWDDASYSAGSHGTNVLSSMFGNDRVFLFPKSYFAVADCLRVASSDSEALILDYFAGSASTAHAVLALNRADYGKRKFVLVEQGEYFDNVTKPRVLKAAYSESWKEGKPQSNDPLSVFIKVLRLESYEDTLNNLELKKSENRLFNDSPGLKEDYLLNYMLDVESRGSLLSTDDFKKPFDYTMKIAVDSAGAFEEQKVDMVETFNYLIGLTVQQVNAQQEKGFVTVTGTLPSGETCLVLWRDCEQVGYEDLNKLCDELKITPTDNRFDVVYINGDHNISTVLTPTDAEGGGTQTLKLRQIEPEFLQRMFAEEDV